MVKTQNHKKIYRMIVDLLDRAHLDRRDIVSRVLQAFNLTKEEINDKTVGGRQAKLRSEIGIVLSEMEARELIAEDDDRLYYLVSSKPVVIRIEMCEKELINALSNSPLTKGEIRNKLKAVFGTDKTATVKDDDILYTFMGQTLKKLTSIGIIYSKDGKYYLSEHALAKANDINEIMTLRADFISTLHSRGGEFFEKYFMELLSQYLKKRGYEVLECYVNGGSDDGGIDGVIKTKDALGFKETTMVQTKNRNDIVSETAVRGFYGAVCASRGTRGIFACVSDFHSSAQKFLDGLDDCIGVNGTVLFKMACECLYGIKKTKDGLSVDQRIFNRG